MWALLWKLNFITSSMCLRKFCKKSRVWAEKPRLKIQLWVRNSRFGLDATTLTARLILSRGNAPRLLLTLGSVVPRTTLSILSLARWRLRLGRQTIQRYQRKLLFEVVGWTVVPFIRKCQGRWTSLAGVSRIRPAAALHSGVWSTKNWREELRTR